MNLEEAKKLLGENSTTDQAKALLSKFEEESNKLVENEVKGLKDNKTKLLEQMTRLKENQLPDGFDIDAYKIFETEKDEIAKKKKELEDAELEGKGQWEALKIRLDETYTTNIESLKNEYGETISSLRKALDKELIENNAIKAIEKEEGNSLFLLPHMLNKIKTVQTEDGDFGIEIIDSKGKARLKEDATTPFGVEDLVAELKADSKFSPAFPKLNSGSGSNANAGGGSGSGGVNPWKKDTKNVTMQADLNKNNPILAAQMKKAAGVS